MLPDAVVLDLKTIYGIRLHQSLSPNAPHFTKEDMERWTALAGGTGVNLSEQIAIYLAKQFHASELTYAFCEAIVNDLLASQSPPRLPIGQNFSIGSIAPSTKVSISIGIAHMMKIPLRRTLDRTSLKFLQICGFQTERLP